MWLAVGFRHELFHPSLKPLRLTLLPGDVLTEALNWRIQDGYIHTSALDAVIVEQFQPTAQDISDLLQRQIRNLEEIFGEFIRYMFPPKGMNLTYPGDGDENAASLQP
jgi:hypothetical protein